MIKEFLFTAFTIILIAFVVQFIFRGKFVYASERAPRQVCLGVQFKLETSPHIRKDYCSGYVYQDLEK